jgi:hypothetical protein
MTAGPVGRNESCSWGKGKKYKKWHGQTATIELAIRPDVADVARRLRRVSVFDSF